MFVKKITNDLVEIKAPAKVNLFLEVLNKREDGFHEINSLFQAVSLYDVLTFQKTETHGVQLSLTNDIDLALDDSNLIVKAYQAIKNSCLIEGGIKVQLEKNIPIAAGLGGGSADAAATIKACNELFSLHLSNQTMAEIGARVGSDLPFFFFGPQAMVSGRGEVIREVEIPHNFSLILINPNLAVSTAEAYAALKRDLTKPKNPFNLAQCRSVEDLVDTLLQTGNDFEEVHLKFFPEFGRIKEGLLQCGARVVRLSGSGPTLFGLFTQPPVINESGSLDCRGDWHTYTVTPIVSYETE